jgi:hypothetical protein
VGVTSVNEGPAPVHTLARRPGWSLTPTPGPSLACWGYLQVDIASALVHSGRSPATRMSSGDWPESSAVRGSSWSRTEGRLGSSTRTPVRIPDGHAFGGDAVVVVVGGHASPAPDPRCRAAAHLPGLHQAVGVTASHIVRELGVAAWASTWSELWPPG